MSKLRNLTLAFDADEIRRASLALKNNIAWQEQTSDEAAHAFRVAYNWRDSHFRYTVGAHRQLRSNIKRLGLKGGFTAARLKRMRSIRKKLRTISAHLGQIQDLGGCRAIVRSMSNVRELVAAYKTDTRLVLKEKSYIENARPSGYRSHHLVMRFNDDNAPPGYAGQRIELQVRTQLQHSWATAVEAVGTFLRQDLKGGVGNGDWLRLFVLMSGEFATIESCALPQTPEERATRREEIIALNNKLSALSSLQNWAEAVRFTEDLVRDPKATPTFYLITYDNKENLVFVKPYFGAAEGASSYKQAEEAEARSGDRFDTVLVESSRVSDLREAYPNYFGDVQLFRDRLEEVVLGQVSSPFTQASLPVRAINIETAIDPAWTRRTSPSWRWGAHPTKPQRK